VSGKFKLQIASCSGIKAIVVLFRSFRVRGFSYFHIGSEGITEDIILNAREE
jgi:hypothetical protein